MYTKQNITHPFKRKNTLFVPTCMNAKGVNAKCSKPGTERQTLHCLTYISKNIELIKMQSKMLITKDSKLGEMGCCLPKGRKFQ